MKELFNPKNPRFYFRLPLVVMLIWVLIAISYIKHRIGLGASDDEVQTLLAALTLVTLFIGLLGQAFAQKMTKH